MPLSMSGAGEAQIIKKIDIHQKLALKKRVYEAGDWNGFRTAVNAHKAFGNHLIINK